MKIAVAVIDTYESKNMVRYALSQVLNVLNINAVYTFSEKPVLSGENFYKIKPILSLKQYSDIVINTLPYCIEEDFLFIVQWDGFPCNLKNWSEDFLKFDYIGAPWLNKSEFCCVGNGGFSLRSQKFLTETLNLPIQKNSNMPESHAEDVVLCQHYRGALEYLGVRFAPKNLAQNFSYEGGLINQHFGFHGVQNFPIFLKENFLIENFKEIVDRCFNKESLAVLLFNSLKNKYFDFYKILVEESLLKEDLHANLAALFLNSNIEMPFFTERK